MRHTHASEMRFLKAIADFEDRHLLVLGDVMLDEYIVGSVTRISPEAPVPIFLPRNTYYSLGGAANVANNIRFLGGRASLYGRIGSDEAGRKFSSLATEHQIDCQGMTVSRHGYSTTKKCRYVTETSQIFRADHETSVPLSEDEETSILSRLDDHIAEFDAVLLSDYGKGFLTSRLLRHIIRVANENEIPVLVDPKTSNLANYAGASLIKPNLNELYHLSNSDSLADHSGVAFDSVFSSLQAICRDHHIAGGIATLGSRGMCVTFDRSREHIPAESVAVFDVTGAGDTVLACLGMSLASGLDLFDSAKLANLAASKAVSERGTSPVTIKALTSKVLCQTQPLPTLISTFDITVIRKAWTACGYTVGFTNGCFDILHSGHIQLFQQARARCDKLIVAVNTDESVRRLKGSTRPINDLKERAELLSALKDVDAVISFDADTPISLIEHLKPDLLVKGADYRPEEVVGAQFVQSYGGKLFLADLLEGRSTSMIVEQIKTRDTNG